MKILLIIIFSLIGTSMNGQKKIIGKYNPILEIFETQDATYWINYFNNGIAKISKDGYLGLIDTTGQIICDPTYDKIFDFDGDFAKVGLDNKYGIINKEGKEVIPTVYQKINITPVGLFIFSNNNKYGILDKDNIVVIQPNYHKIDYLFKGVFKVLDETELPIEKAYYYNSIGKWGVINSLGEILLPCDYDVILATNKNKGIAEKFDFNPPFNRQINPISSERIGIEADVSGSLEYFNNEGILKNHSFSASHGIHSISKAHFEYKDLENFTKQIIDRDFLFPNWLPNVHPLGLRNEFSILSSGVVVLKNGKYGFKDFTGKEILPCIYDSLTETETGSLMVTLEGKTYLINKKGNKIKQ